MINEDKKQRRKATEITTQQFREQNSRRTKRECKEDGRILQKEGNDTKLNTGNLYQSPVGKPPMGKTLQMKKGKKNI